jgi:hypothetical protein
MGGIMRGIFLIMGFCLGVFRAPVQAEVIDMVAAFVDSEAITLSELDAEYGRALGIEGLVTRGAVLDRMINRVLLLREARRLRIDAPDTEALLTEYVNMKLRAFVTVTESSAREYYRAHREDDFREKDYAEVRDRIIQYLREEEAARRLDEHLSALRAKSYIRILLDEPPAPGNP